LTNHKRDTFLGRFSAGFGVRLMTKADLFRRIMDLDIREYIKVVGYEISETLPAIPEAESMNWFIPEGLIPFNHRRFLSLQFETVEDELLKWRQYLLRDKLLKDWLDVTFSRFSAKRWGRVEFIEVLPLDSK